MDCKFIFFRKAGEGLQLFSSLEAERQWISCYFFLKMYYKSTTNKPQPGSGFVSVIALVVFNVLYSF